MRKTFLILGAIFTNLLLGALSFLVAGSGALGILISGSVSIIAFVLYVLLWAVIVCLVNLLFFKLLKLSFWAFALIALPSLLFGLVFYFILYVAGL